VHQQLPHYRSVTNTESRNTMKAVLWEGYPYNMTVKTVPKPTIQRPTDVVVRVTTAAICGSDLHEFHGLVGALDAPFVMGHEVRKSTACEL
jgi:threonine dehydrogenase-like Zn-dependent dehydrogenase